MYSDVNPAKPFEVFEVSNPNVMCEGSGGVLGHPVVYLQINPDIGEIACPYCSREFKLTRSANAAH